MRPAAWQAWQETCVGDCATAAAQAAATLPGWRQFSDLVGKQGCDVRGVVRGGPRWGTHRDLG